MVVADSQGQVLERGQRVSDFGLNSGQDERQVCSVVAVSAVFGDGQTTTQGLHCCRGIFLTESDPIGKQHESLCIWVRSFSCSSGQFLADGNRLVTRTRKRKNNSQVRPCESMGIVAAG